MLRSLEDEKFLDLLDDQDFWEIYERNKNKLDIKKKNIRLIKKKARKRRRMIMDQADK